MAEDAPNAVAVGSAPASAAEGSARSPRGIRRSRPSGGYRGRQGRGGAAPVAQHLAAVAAHARCCGAPPRADARGAQRLLPALRRRPGAQGRARRRRRRGRGLRTGSSRRTRSLASVAMGARELPSPPAAMALAARRRHLAQLDAHTGGVAMEDEEHWRSKRWLMGQGWRLFFLAVDQRLGTGILFFGAC